jgi:FlaG/FlaF family flagellin (archaellin)
MEKCHGVSTVISIVLLVVMAVVLSSVLFIVVSNMVNKQKYTAPWVALTAEVTADRTKFFIYITKLPGESLLCDDLTFSVINKSGAIFLPPDLHLYSVNGSIKTSGQLLSTDYWSCGYNATYMEFRVYTKTSFVGSVKFPT